MLDNIILKTDSYKTTHYKQYPPDTRHIFSYLEARDTQSLDSSINPAHSGIVFFGLQYILKKHFEGIQVTPEKIEQAEDFLSKHIGPDQFNLDGWARLFVKHDGRLPVEIKAVPEGSVNKRGDVLLTIQNTDPEFYWLTNYLETLLMQVWYPITVCTKSYEIKKIISHYLEKTGDDISGLPFKLHDFGYRGVSSSESAAIGGAAHLVNFMGTDTLASIELLREYYGADMPGHSIPASEHSTMTAWGADNEAEAMKNMLEQYKDSPIIACVSDSYDIYNACENIWGTELKDLVFQEGRTLIIRPDSGEPVEVILKCLDILGDKFGALKNEQGYKMLPPNVRLIQGDGVDTEAINVILANMKIKGWAADNIAFGMGGGLLQKLNRDTFSFALKCCAIDKGNGWEDVYKNPITDIGKASKRGYYESDNLEVVFRDGELIRDYTLDDVKGNLNWKEGK